MKRIPHKVRAPRLRQMKEHGQKITVMTAYDAITGLWVEKAGIDVALVGDSLGNTALGFEDSIAVTLDHMIHHCAAVARRAERALIVADLPFMTYKISAEQALTNAARMIQEGGAEAVKLEGGAELAEIVARLYGAGIPVMGHIGMQMQSTHAQGGLRVQGRDEASAEGLMRDALALEEAGAFAIVLELIPRPLATQISERLSIPTIGIGAGAGCDGQVLVLSDMLGMDEERELKHVHQYANLMDIACEGIRNYIKDVQDEKFPRPEHGFDA